MTTSVTTAKAVDIYGEMASTSTSLVCFPPAGAGAYEYGSWARVLPKSVSVYAVRFPGREKLIRVEAYRSIPPLVKWLSEVLAPVLTKPFHFFGHSMGALVAFELTRELRRQGLPLPAALLVSGHRAPQLARDQPRISELSDAEFIERVRRLGGIADGVPENPELREMILPILRADLHAWESYEYRPAPPFRLPILAFRGRLDPIVSHEDLEAWRVQTVGGFSVKQFPGHHFYIREKKLQLLGEIMEVLTIGGSDR